MLLNDSQWLLNDSQWLTSLDSFALLLHLRASHNVATDQQGRKLRLFACACCRLMLEACKPNFAEYSEIISLAERYAEGEIDRTRCLASRLQRYLVGEPLHLGAHLSALASLQDEDPYSAATGASAFAPHAIGCMNTGRTYHQALANQAIMVRDLFGNPFRRVAVPSEWRTETVLALARGVYVDRAFDRLPILADALEEAGCSDPELLAHCRSSGPHALGCWVLDLVLAARWRRP